MGATQYQLEVQVVSDGNMISDYEIHHTRPSINGYLIWCPRARPKIVNGYPIFFDEESNCWKYNYYQIKPVRFMNSITETSGWSNSYLNITRREEKNNKFYEGIPRRRLLWIQI